MLVERLDAVGRLPENQDPTKQFAISIARRALLDAKVTDPGPESTVDRLPFSTKPEVVLLNFREKFTAKERKAIEAKGGLVYTSTGLTILAQGESQARKGKPSFRYITEGGDQLLRAPSMKTQIAIFPVPSESFVPGSFGKDLPIQERMAAEDAKRLGLPNVTQIIPNEASTLTGIVFQHLEATDEWLFGQEYANAQDLDYVYARTKNPTNSSGSNVAGVGSARPVHGVYVDDFPRDHGRRNLGAFRLVVPIKTK